MNFRLAAVLSLGLALTARKRDTTWKDLRGRYCADVASRSGSVLSYLNNVERQEKEVATEALELPAPLTGAAALAARKPIFLPACEATRDGLVLAGSVVGESVALAKAFGPATRARKTRQCRGDWRDIPGHAAEAVNGLAPCSLLTDKVSVGAWQKRADENVSSLRQWVGQATAGCKAIQASP
jgi:hypothetical protein